LPLRRINPPFYYALGGHARDQQLQTLVLSQQNNAEAQSRFSKSLGELKLEFNGIKVCLNDTYLETLKTQLTDFSDRVPIKNPCCPP
jgi:hypothetical protein